MTLTWQGSNVGFNDSLERIGRNRIQDQPQYWKVGALHQHALLWYSEHTVDRLPLHRENFLGQEAREQSFLGASVPNLRSVVIGSEQASARENGVG